MTAPRAAFLATPSRDLDAEPRVSDRTADLGVVVVYLSEDVRVHVGEAAFARAQADTWVKAARLLEDAEPQVIEGRSEPRTGPVEHDVRFFPAEDMIVAKCQPCWPWSVAIEGGHDAADLARLAAMHCGVTA